MTNSDGEDGPEPANLRFLRRLVTTLTGVMLAGLILVIALLVIRFREAPPTLPEAISLPDDATAQAVTIAEGLVLVLSEDGRLFVYDRLTGQLERTIPVIQDQ